MFLFFYSVDTMFSDTKTIYIYIYIYITRYGQTEKDLGYATSSRNRRTELANGL